MKKNRILITINNLEDIDYYNKLDLYNIVYPIKDFCVGYPNTFSMEEIPNNSYILLNRVLDTDGIDNFQKLYNKYKNKIKGVIFEDLGVLEILKNESVEKILYLSHFNANIASIKLYLQFVDSVIPSTDINEKELEYIQNNIKEVTLFTFGYIIALYSRRYLISNYEDYHNLKNDNPMLITNDDTSFKVYENEYGTVFYHSLISDLRISFNYDVKYYFINMVFLDKELIPSVLDNLSIENTDACFLDKKLICKIKGDSDV